MIFKKLNILCITVSYLRRYLDSAYLEVKILSLFQYGNLTIGHKLLWKKGDIEQILFSTIFSIYLQLQESNYIIHLWNVAVWFIFSSILQIWYVEVRIVLNTSESLWIRDNESRLYSVVPNNTVNGQRMKNPWMHMLLWTFATRISNKSPFIVDFFFFFFFVISTLDKRNHTCISYPYPCYTECAKNTVDMWLIPPDTNNLSNVLVLPIT